MKSGHIQQFAHLKQFKSVEQFNKTIDHVIATYGNQFTRSELLAFKILTRFSVKQVGVCNARICKLVEASQSEKGGVSRSTFERMLRKAKQLGILSIHHTIRKKGGFSHSVYVFHHFDGAPEEKLTERALPEKAVESTTETDKIPHETPIHKNKQKRRKDLRPISIEELDYTYVPGYVPEQWTKAVKPFFSRAVEICKLWDRALIAYRSRKLDSPIENYLPMIVKAFKQTVFQYKRGKIQTCFQQYFYGTITTMLAVEARREYARQNQQRWSWLRGT